jgi:enamine deaminase RidA (YjgF/YER057c/UK114 family)
MPKRALSHPNLPDPPHFSRAVETTGGRTVYFAGQAPLDAEGNVAGSTLGEQTETCLDKMAGILEAAGGSMADIVHLVVYVTNIDDFGQVQPARDKHFSGPVYPAMSGVQVSALADPAWLVEIDGIAVID